jgi:hypothetical protein
MNGDGRDDIVGTWSGIGVWYKDSIGGSWVNLSSPASLLATGDLNGGNKDDLIGVWSSGLWVKYSETDTWEKFSTALPNDIDTGVFRTGAWGAGATGYLDPVGGHAERPGSLTKYEDLSEKGPGGLDFVYQEEESPIPQEIESLKMRSIPGPGEPGFMDIKQKNLVSRESKN